MSALENAADVKLMDERIEEEESVKKLLEGVVSSVPEQSFERKTVVATDTLHVRSFPRRKTLGNESFFSKRDKTLGILAFSEWLMVVCGMWDVWFRRGGGELVF
jgi:hypothetical protein